jgi:FkbM family methyltransferase
MEDLYDIAFLKTHLKSDPVIVDVGANAGFFSLFMAARFPASKIFAFEPLPANFSHLQRHFQLNSRKALVCQNKAVAGKKGFIELYYNPDANFTALASMHTAFDGSNTSRVEVEAVPLPDIFSQFRIESVDLLKLDCEGAEYDILYHCPDQQLSRVRMIAMETHPGTGINETTEAICQFLAGKGVKFKTGSNNFVWAWR